jgi:hypothetical protein
MVRVKESMFQKKHEPFRMNSRSGTRQIVMKVFSFARTSCATAAGTTAPA